MSLPVRLYLHFFAVDMLLGAALSVLGFVDPDRYLTFTLSPMSAVESVAFLIATLLFAIHVAVNRAERRLLVLPGFVFAVQLLMTAVFQAALHGAPTDGTSLAAAQLEAMQTLPYLGASLLSSLGGVAIWSWLTAWMRSSEARVASERLRGLREKRLLSEKSSR